MKSPVTLVVGALAALAFLAAAVLAGVVPLPFLDDGDRPPCSQLPTEREVHRALASRHEFVADIEAAGSGVTVAPGRPCGDQDRALVTIEVSTGEERSRVERLLREGNGFGVPAEIVDQ